jgi:hypothetical protein
MADKAPAKKDKQEKPVQPKVQAAQQQPQQLAAADPKASAAPRKIQLSHPDPKATANVRPLIESDEGSKGKKKK